MPTSPDLHTSANAYVSFYKARMLGFPEIATIQDLGNQLRLPITTIHKYTQRHSRSSIGYKVFEIPKKPNGSRIIHTPERTLKFIQVWILRNILEKLKSHHCASAFEPGASCFENAKKHLNKSYIINSDIRDFFPSITANKVYSIFKSIGYSKEVSWTLTNLVTINGKLPQGSPSSPKLANLICHRIDARIYGYCRKNNLNYTRYADDISLSTSNRKLIKQTLKFVKSVIKNEGFELRDDKTIVYGKKKAKIVTGLVVDKEVRVGRNKYRELRSILHTATKHNDQEKLNYFNGYMNHLKGTDNKTYKLLLKYKEKFTTTES